MKNLQIIGMFLLIEVGIAWPANSQSTAHQCGENDTDPKCVILKVREMAMERAQAMEVFLRLVQESPEIAPTSDEKPALLEHCYKNANIALVAGQRFDDEKLEVQGARLKILCQEVLE